MYFERDAVFRTTEKGEPLFDFLQIGIEVPRDVLYQRISERVDMMMKLGLLKEVEELVKRKYPWSLPSMRESAIGSLRIILKKITLDQAIENLKQDTRRYAKRQLTWFKRDERIRWVEKYEEAERLVDGFLTKN